MSAKIRAPIIYVRAKTIVLGGRLLGDAYFRRLDWFLGANIGRSMRNESIVRSTTAGAHVHTHIFQAPIHTYKHMFEAA